MTKTTHENRRYRTREVAQILGVAVSDIDNLTVGGAVVPDHQQARGRRRLWSWANVQQIALVRRVLMPCGIDISYAARTASTVFRSILPKMRKKGDNRKLAILVFPKPFELNPALTPIIQYDTDDELQQGIQQLWNQWGGPNARPVYIVVDISAITSRTEKSVRSLLATGGIKGGKND